MHEPRELSPASVRQLLVASFPREWALGVLVSAATVLFTILALSPAELRVFWDMFWLLVVICISGVLLLWIPSFRSARDRAIMEQSRADLLEQLRLGNNDLRASSQRLEDGNKRLEQDNRRLRGSLILDARARAIALCDEIQGFLNAIRAEGAKIREDQALSDQERYERLRILDSIRVINACGSLSPTNFGARLQRSYADIYTLDVDGGPFTALLFENIQGVNGKHPFDALQKSMIHLRTIATHRMKP